MEKEITQENKIQNRAINFDLLRVIASLAVVFIHASASFWYYTDVTGFTWQTFNVYDSLSRWGVPVFVMISGAFMTDKELSVKTIVTKYILRLMCVYLFWGIVYYLSYGESIILQIKGIFIIGSGNFSQMIRGHYHMWFIPMIAGIYLCIPILKKIAENEKLTRYFLALAFIFSFAWPQAVEMTHDLMPESINNIVNALNGSINQLTPYMVMGYAAYFILGYYMSKTVFSKRTRIVIYTLGILGFLATVILTSHVSISQNLADNTYYESFTVNVLLEAMAVFELFKNIKIKNVRAGKIIRALSKWSLGAYMAHLVFIEVVLPKFNLTTLSFNPVLSVPVISIITFVTAYAISGLINQLPILKKYIV